MLQPYQRVGGVLGYKQTLAYVLFKTYNGEEIAERKQLLKQMWNIRKNQTSTKLTKSKKYQETQKQDNKNKKENERGLYQRQSHRKHDDDDRDGDEIGCIPHKAHPSNEVWGSVQ